MPIHPQDPSPSALTTPDHAPILPSILDAVVWLLADQHRLVAPDMYARRNALDALNQHLLDADMASVRVETERLRRRDPPIAGLASYAEDVAALAAIAENAKDRYARARDLIREPLRKLHAPKESPPSAPATATKETPSGGVPNDLGCPCDPPLDPAVTALKAAVNTMDRAIAAMKATKAGAPMFTATMTVDGQVLGEVASPAPAKGDYTPETIGEAMNVLGLTQKAPPDPLLAKLDQVIALLTKLATPVALGAVRIDCAPSIFPVPPPPAPGFPGSTA
jgi:hypothetical protein